MFSLQSRHVILFGLVAIAGHLLGVLADVYSGFVPSVDAQLGPVTSLSLANIAPLLRAKPLAQARIGHFLAIFFIPLGLSGIWQVFTGLDPSRNKLSLVFLVSGMLGIIYATFYHGTLAFVVGALQAQPLATGGSSGINPIDLVEYFNSLSEPLSWVLLMADLLVSLLYVFLVWARPTSFPRWMAVVNPISIQLVLSLLILAAPHPVSQLLWLTVFNASLAIWYIVTTTVLSRGAA